MKKIYAIFLSVFLISCTNYKGTNYTGQIIIEESAMLNEAVTPYLAAEPSQPPMESSKPAANPTSEYIIDLEIEPVNRIVKGVQRVKYTNSANEALDHIYFNLYLNAFDKNVVNKPYFQSFENKIFSRGRDYGYINIIKATIDKEDAEYAIDGTAMDVILDEPLMPGTQIEMTLYFEAYIPLISHRTGANEHASWYGNFLPIIAVYDDKGWHTSEYYPAGDPFYSEVSNYTVNVTTPTEYIVVGPGIEKNHIKDGKKVTSLTASMTRDFAFAVSDEYNVASITTDNGADINFYYYSNIPEPYNSLELAKNAVKFFDEKIGAYPYPTLNIVECELFLQGGMEYPQVIFMDSAYLQSDFSYRSIIHEISHQWFYSMIGNDQINEAWLDEGFASFIQDTYIHADSFDAHMLREYESLEKAVNKISDPRLTGSLSIYDKWSDYYNVHYMRGKLMIYALKIKMGDQLFSEFLKTYYNRYCFKTVSGEGFIQVAEEVYGESLTDFFTAWIIEKELPALRR